MTAFPWYDSPWLATYVEVKAWIERAHPGRLAEFEERLAPLRTNPAFQTKQIAQVFDAGTLREIRETVRNLKPEQLELHEVRNFGRFIVHDHSYFTELQFALADLVGEAVGERVEPRYNFLSLYTKTGICDVHLDAPSVKWTLDVCIDQSEEWPIHFSQPVPWPEAADYAGPHWQEAIKRDPGLRFTPYCMKPGSALAFSGSSQWHYRDALPPASGNPPFCDLLFFHYIPWGMRELAGPRNWPGVFGIPELSTITARFHE